MYDPTSSVSAPPPRYLLESDSSDEEGQGAYGGQRPPKLRVPEPEVTLHLLSGGTAPLEAQQAVVGVGQAGAYLLRGAAGGKPAFALEADGARIGTGVLLPDGVLLVAVREQGDWRAVRTLLDGVRAEKWSVSVSVSSCLLLV